MEDLGDDLLDSAADELDDLLDSAADEMIDLDAAADELFESEAPVVVHSRPGAASAAAPSGASWHDALQVLPPSLRVEWATTIQSDVAKQARLPPRLPPSHAYVAGAARSNKRTRAKRASTGSGSSAPGSEALAGLVLMAARSCNATSRSGAPPLGNADELAARLEDAGLGALYEEQFRSGIRARLRLDPAVRTALAEEDPERFPRCRREAGL